MFVTGYLSVYSDRKVSGHVNVCYWLFKCVLRQESEWSCICLLNVSSQESEWSYIYVLEVQIHDLSLSWLGTSNT